MEGGAGGWHWRLTREVTSPVKGRHVPLFLDRFLDTLFSAGSSQCTGERLCWAMDQVQTVPPDHWDSPVTWHRSWRDQGGTACFGCRTGSELSKERAPV